MEKLNNVKIIKKKVKGFGDAWLVKKGKNFYVVSGVDAMFSGWEVLVFKSNKKGEVENWLDVAGGRGMTHEEAVEELENNSKL